MQYFFTFLAPRNLNRKTLKLFFSLNQRLSIRPFGRRVVAILITLEYIVQHLATMTCSHLKVFRDSQSSVGILTFNWKDTSYTSITRNVGTAINMLQHVYSQIRREIIWGYPDTNCLTLSWHSRNSPLKRYFEEEKQTADNKTWEKP